MTTITGLDVQENTRPTSTLSRVFSYAVFKAAALVVTVAVGLFLTILVLNFGGYVDQIKAAYIEEAIGARIQGGWLNEVPEPDRTNQIDQARAAMREAAGLNKPFLQRCFIWLVESMTLSLGNGGMVVGTQYYHGEIVPLVLQRLPYTLLLVGLGNLLVFVFSITLALVISRRYSGWLDKAVTLLTPLFAAPTWIHGIILTFFLAGQLHLLPFPKNLGAPIAGEEDKYFRLLFNYLALPVIAVTTSKLFQSVYTWRTFFLIYSEESYVELARAKGLPTGVLERRYILRPSLPYVITNFAMLMLSIWQEAIALELLFFWPGVAIMFIQSVRSLTTSLTMGIVVVFAYLLAITIFVLDVIYALVDPRIKLGGSRPLLHEARRPQKLIERLKIWWESWHQPAPVKVAPGNFGFAGQRSETNKQPASVKSETAHSRFKTGIDSLWFELLRNPSAIVGLVIVMLIIIASLYTVIAVPPNDAMLLWRSQGDDPYRSTWYRNPQLVPPAWTNFFRTEKLPETIILDSWSGGSSRQDRDTGSGTMQRELIYTFKFPYDEAPQDIVLYVIAQYKEKYPFITMTWITPDGREIDLGGRAIPTQTSFYLSRDERLKKKFKGDILKTLFADPAGDGTQVLRGTYKLKLIAMTFETGSQVEAQFISYGKVYGLAGTDNSRRDLLLALMWGMPIALAFGVFGALFTNILAMLISAFGVWFGGWLDGIIQRITEVNLIIPTLPIAIMIYVLYSKSIWIVLGVVVLLNIFGSTIKTYRATFLQIKDASYVEAARAYGASDWRMVSRYLLPRIFQTLIPQLVIMVPGYVYYEATLAFLGVSDPYLPTWGKVIAEALNGQALQNAPHWILEPIALLVITSMAFALFGFALDRILNPTLRTK